MNTEGQTLEQQLVQTFKEHDIDIDKIIVEIDHKEVKWTITADKPGEDHE